MEVDEFCGMTVRVCSFGRVGVHTLEPRKLVDAAQSGVALHVPSIFVPLLVANVHDVGQPLVVGIGGDELCVGRFDWKASSSAIHVPSAVR